MVLADLLNFGRIAFELFGWRHCIFSVETIYIEDLKKFVDSFAR